MRKNEQGKVWIVIDHPQHLATAISVSRTIYKKSGKRPNLIISQHAYWRGIKFDEYKKEFGKIKKFERLDYPPPSLMPYIQAAVCVLMIPKMFRLRRFVKNLKIGEDDLIFGLSTHSFLENAILSYYKNVRCIGVVVSFVFEYAEMSPPANGYHYSIGSFIVKYLEKLFGMYEVVCEYKNRKGGLMDGDTIQKYKYPLTKIYDFVFVMKNNADFNEFDSSIVPGKPIFTGYPYHYSLAKEYVPKKKWIVFLGDDFLSANNIDHKTHAVLVNRCLHFLKDKYADKYTLVYKPHPRWNEELKVLDISGYKIYRKHEVAEMFFIKNKGIIHSVFSVASTGSRSAINAGIQSYFFYKLFPFKTSTLEDYKTQLGTLPKNSIIENLDVMPKKISDLSGELQQDDFTKKVVKTVDILFSYSKKV